MSKQFGRIWADLQVGEEMDPVPQDDESLIRANFFINELMPMPKNKEVNVFSPIQLLSCKYPQRVLGSIVGISLQAISMIVMVSPILGDPKGQSNAKIGMETPEQPSTEGMRNDLFHQLIAMVSRAKPVPVCHEVLLPKHLYLLGSTV